MTTKKRTTKPTNRITKRRKATFPCDADTAPAKRRRKGGEALNDPDCALAPQPNNGNGEKRRDSEIAAAIPRHKKNGERGLDSELVNAVQEQKGVDDVSGDAELRAVDSLCSKLQALQRELRAIRRFRMQIDNGTLAYVASQAFGYHSGMTEKERAECWTKAKNLVKRIDAGDDSPPGSEAIIVQGVVRFTKEHRESMADGEQAIVDKMITIAKQLPVAPWFDHPDRRGISLSILSTVVGESGDLANYPNPAKLWKRLFNAPHTHEGKTRMPSQWIKLKKLHAADWMDIGYCPRRNASMFALRENIVKQNGPDSEKTAEKKKEKGRTPNTHCGPYRARYDEIRAKVADRDPKEWPKIRQHKHAQLLAAKRFILDLWKEWNGK